MDKNNKNWFFFTLLYLIVDYGRPQDILPIGFLRPGMIIIIILSGFLIFGGQLREARSKQTKMILLFIILTALYVPFAHNNYFAYRTTEIMILFLPFILSTIICVNSITRLKSIVLVCVCLMIYLALYSALHGGTGTGNYFQDENDISLFINMWIPFCFFLFMAENKQITKLIYGIGLLTGIVSVIVTFSRGGFIGLLCITFTSWVYSSKKLLSLLIIGLLGVMIFFFASDAYWARISTLTHTDEGTAFERIETWKAGWRMFLDNPLGVGGHNFEARFPDYQSDNFKKNMWGRAAHSLWLTLVPELGIVGIFIYFTLLFYNLRDIFDLRKLRAENDPDLKYIRYLSCAFIASLAGFFSSGTFLSVLYYPHYWYLTGIIVAATKIARNIADKNIIKTRQIGDRVKSPEIAAY